MPYTASTVPDHVPAPRARQWAAAWNNAHRQCMADGGQEDECEQMAFRIANGLLSEARQGKPMATMILAEAVELLESTLNAEARTVEVVLIRPGWSANGRYYSPDVLAQAAPLFEGVKAYANHPTRDQLKRGESRSVLDITGDYTDVRIGEGGELRAVRHVYGKAGEAVWPLIERSVATKRSIIGVSINALGKAAAGKADGKEGIIVEAIERANSADDVDSPAAGGGFETLMMSDDRSLVSDLLATLSYDEFVEARPDHVETLKKQLKRARQDETVRALTSERDAALTALNEATADREALAAQVEAIRAETARLRDLLALEKALREANFNPKFEALLRQRLEKAAPAEWTAILVEERAKLRAAGVRPAPVPVYGAPFRESRPVVWAEQAASGVIDMNIFNTPDKLAAELTRRATARK